ncbi:MAG: tetratricopeptide repeat protein [Planctomycetota bacterium]
MNGTEPTRTSIGLWPALLLALVIGLLYGIPVHDHGYIYDDYKLIETNGRLAGPWTPLQHWWQPLWEHSGTKDLGMTGYWRPLTLLVLAWSKALSAGAAWGPHLVSVLVHFLASLGAASLACRLGLARWPAFAAALLFAVHPVQVQSVAWASSINDPLIGMFGLWGLSWFVAAVRGQGTRYAILSAVALLGGVLSKEQAIGMLPLAALLAWLEGRGRGRAAWLALAPLAVVALAWYGMRVAVYDSWSGGFRGAIADFALSGARPMTFRIELFGGFWKLLLWPVHLVFFRTVRPNLPSGDPEFLAAAVLSLLWLAAMAMSLLRRQRLAVFLLALPAVWLAPQILNYEAAGAFPLSDRYLYVPVFAVACGVAALLGRLRAPIALPAGVAVLVGLSAWKNLSELPEYRDDIPFFENAIRDNPDAAVAWWSLGRENLDLYRISQRKPYLDEAMAQFWSCLTLGRDFGNRTPNLDLDRPVAERIAELEKLVHGSTPMPPLGDRIMISGEDILQANLGQGWGFIAAATLPPDYDAQPAVDAFRQITQVRPERVEAWIGLAMALDAANDLAEARKAAAKAIEVDRLSPDAWSTLGKLQRREKLYQEAASSFAEAARLRVGSLRDHLEQIRCLLDGGQIPAAEGQLNELARQHPDDPEVTFLRGMVAANRGQWPIALEHFDRLLHAEPMNAPAHLQRGKVLTQMGRTTDAVQALARVCELDPSNFEAHALLGEIFLLDPGTRGQAQEYLERAYGLGGPGQDRRKVQLRLAEWYLDDADALFAHMLMDERRHEFEACLRWIEVLQRKPRWSGVPDRKGRMAAVQLSAGNCLVALGAPDRAENAWREAIELDPTQFWAYNHLGEMLYGQERYADALPFLEGALARIEQVSEKQNLRGAMRMRLGDLAKAARERGPDLQGPPLAPR